MEPTLIPKPFLVLSFPFFIMIFCPFFVKLGHTKCNEHGKKDAWSANNKNSLHLLCHLTKQKNFIFFTIYVVFIHM